MDQPVPKSLQPSNFTDRQADTAIREANDPLDPRWKNVILGGTTEIVRQDKNGNVVGVMLHHTYVNRRTGAVVADAYDDESPRFLAHHLQGQPEKPLAVAGVLRRNRTPKGEQSEKILESGVLPSAYDFRGPA